MIYDEIAMNNGVIFQRTYDILNERMQLGIINLAQGSNGMDGKATLDAALFVAVVVNSAFSCELFMKSMLPKGTKGHKLDELFYLLDNDIQSRIEKITVNRMKELKKTYCSMDFQSDLNSNSNKFAEWRYFHEKGNCSANIQFISRFMKAIFDVVNEERKK